MKKLAWGGAQPNVSSKQVEEMYFPIPDIKTQFNIIEFINDLKNKKLKTKIYFSQSVEEKILKLQETTLKIFDFSSEQEKQTNIVSQLKKAVLQEAIAGQLTAEWRTQNPMEKGNPDTDATALLAKIKAEKQQLIADGKLKKEKPLAEIAIDEIPFSLPDSWVWCRLGSITTLITDGKHGDCQNEANSGYYFLSAKDVKNGKLIHENARQITFKDFTEVHRRTNLEAGDICLVNTGATIGKTAIVQPHEFTSKTTFQKSVAVIKVLKNLTSIQYLEKILIS